MTQNQQKLIGGKFGFPVSFPEVSQFPGFLQGNPILLFNARSGIKLVLDQLKPARIWLPSYLCPTIISAVDQAQVKIKFYEVDASLKVASTTFLSDLEPKDLFLCIDYFGFPFDQDLLQQVKSKECHILRDCSQALFFDWQLDSISDFHLFSPRKFLGVPDGGILQMAEKSQLPQPELCEPDVVTLSLLIKAMIFRRDFDLNGNEQRWYDLFKQGESQFKPLYSSMSDLTKVLLKDGFNYEAIMNQRRKNYLVLLENISWIALFDDLADEVVPLGFPIRIPNRDAFQKKLFASKIFPPIHWDISRVVPSEFTQSHRLSNEILTIPCDQRYDEQDMEFISTTILNVI